MKKALVLLLICAVITTNTACSKSNTSKDNNNSSTIETENVNQNETDVSMDTSEEKVDTESKTEAEVKPEVKPEPKPETKPVSKPSSKPSKKPVTKPETKPETKPDTKPDTKPEDSVLNGELKDIIEKIYSISEVKLPKTGCTEVTSSNSKYYLGTDKVEFSKGLASEPLMGSFAHSMVLLRVDKGADIDKIKSEIKNNVDPRKWICVGVEPDNVVVDNVDNLIILIMDKESEKLHKAFLSLAK